MPTTVADVLATLRNDIRKTAFLVDKHTKPLARSKPALLNIFITFGHKTPQEKRDAIELANENTKMCKDTFQASNCKTVWQNYSGDVRTYNTENAIYAGRGKPARVNFNVQQHPDEACKIMLKVALHVHHQLHSNHLFFAQIVTHGRKGRRYNSTDLSGWMNRQVKHSPNKMFAFIIPCVRFLILKCGEAEAFKDAGYHGRLQFWYDHFDEFPYIISKYAFEDTAEVWNLEALHGGGPAVFGAYA